MSNDLEGPFAAMPTEEAVRLATALARAFAEIAEMEHEYVGEELDGQLAEFGLSRHSGESDRDFRNRVFPAVFAQD